MTLCPEPALQCSSVIVSIGLPVLSPAGAARLRLGRARAWRPGALCHELRHGGAAARPGRAGLPAAAGLGLALPSDRLLGDLGGL